MFSPRRNAQPDPVVPPLSPAIDTVSPASSLDLSLEDLALGTVTSSEGSPTNLPGESRIRPHAKYYFRETNIQLVVEDVIYNVPRILLSQLSNRLQDLLEQPVNILPPGWIEHSTLLGERIYINYGARLVQQTRPCAVGPFTDAHPLFNVTVAEFDAFLSVIIRGRDDYDEYKLDKDQWTFVLKLATLWDNPSIRALALRHLDLPMFALTPFERLRIARVHLVSEWIDDALRGLIQRAGPLTKHEFALMTDEDAEFVTSSREKAAADAPPAVLQRSPWAFQFTSPTISKAPSAPCFTSPVSHVLPPSKECVTLEPIAEALPYAFTTEPFADVPDPDPKPKKRLDKAQRRKLKREKKAAEAESIKAGMVEGGRVQTQTPLSTPFKDPAASEVLAPPMATAGPSREAVVVEPIRRDTSTSFDHGSPSARPVPALEATPDARLQAEEQQPPTASPALPSSPLKKSASPQPSAAIAGIRSCSSLNKPPGEGTGSSGLEGLFGGVGREASGWGGLRGIGDGSNDQTSLIPQREVPMQKIGSSSGTPAPVAANDDCASGGDGLEEDEIDFWGLLHALGSDPPVVADQPHLNATTSADIGETAHMSGVPSSARTLSFSRIGTPPIERSDGLKDTAVAEQKEKKKEYEQEYDWYRYWQYNKVARVGGDTGGTGTPAPATRGKGKKKSKR